MKDIERPNVEQLLAPLKGFQRRTVDYVFDRLYTAEDTTNRFLVADEVGLGKTLVARGVIVKAIDHLWEGVDRIDVVYICSNAAIARQNIRKLRIGHESELSLATRLTMLPAKLKGLNERKLNFVSFTPGTSFDLKSKGGASYERVVLYWLLKGIWGYRSGLRNIMQGGVRRHDYWLHAISPSQKPELDETLVANFAREAKLSKHSGLKNRYDELCQVFHRYRQHWTWEQRYARDQLIGEYRQMLARTCIEALEPDLVILDEFQRFKHLLRNDDEMSQLAQCLFDYRAPEGHMCPVLLLSATPYRMYSTDGEVGEDDHYPDFIKTTEFLMNEPERIERFTGQLRDFRQALHAGMHGSTSDIASSRDVVQAELKRIMVRTERVTETKDRESMVVEPACPAPLNPTDISQYAAVDAIANCLGERDPIEFWKSAPYLLNFMKGYKLKQRFNESLKKKSVAETLRHHKRSLLKQRTISDYRKLDPANARLRVLMEQLLDRDQWKLLWAPPSLPYWPFEHPYTDAGGQFTKALVFSSWNVVPDVVSAVLSYEAERRMLEGEGTSYGSLHKKLKGLLRFAISEGRPSGMPVLALLYPCLTLADAVVPLDHAIAGTPSVRKAVQEQVEQLLTTLPNGTGEVDEKWYWAAPFLLDARKTDIRGFLDSWKLLRPISSDEASERGVEAREDSLFVRHLEWLREILADPRQLGRKPQNLGEVVTELALGGPGIVAARAFRSIPIDDDTRRGAATRVAEGFRSLFNQPIARSMCRRFYPDMPYWRSTLNYGIAGNLQALIDEYLHQLWEQGGWQNEETENAAMNIAGDIAYAATIKTSRVSADILGVRRKKIRQDRLSIRTSFALRYGRLVSDDLRLQARENAVRVAFNSPFHPFVLVTTSIGQEGLDFHPWCHAVYHWNLPGNPVDLEQREGRIHRYKGHAIRKNLAEQLGVEALRGYWSPGDDPWQKLFERAEELRGPDDMELTPFWLFEGEHKIERRVPLLPYSREIERLKRLKKDLVAYRLVFGQPRQQELLEAIQDSGLSAKEMEKWMLDLRP